MNQYTSGLMIDARLKLILEDRILLGKEKVK